MAYKQVAGSIDLYPCWSFKPDIRVPTFKIKIRGAEIQVLAWICTDLAWHRPTASRPIKQKLWSPRTREVMKFVRIDVHTGQFFDEWSTTAYEMRHSSKDWLRIHRLNCIQALLGDDFFERWVMAGRPFDPEDFRRKRKREFTDGVSDTPSRSTILSTADIKLATTEDTLWSKRIPEATKAALILSPKIPIGPSQDLEGFIEEIGSFAANQFDKKTDFRTKRDNFKNRYSGYECSPELRHYFIEIAREAIYAGHRDLRFAASQVKDQIYRLIQHECRTPSPAERYFDFWYGENAITAALGGLVLAATPVRSIIHRQPYAVFDAFEKAMFLEARVPDHDTLCSIYAYSLTYPEWLATSRSYDRARH